MTSQNICCANLAIDRNQFGEQFLGDDMTDVLHRRHLGSLPLDV